MTLSRRYMSRSRSSHSRRSRSRSRSKATRSRSARSRRSNSYDGVPYSNSYRSSVRIPQIKRSSPDSLNKLLDSGSNSKSLNRGAFILNQFLPDSPNTYEDPVFSDFSPNSQRIVERTRSHKSPTARTLSRRKSSSPAQG